ncbi:MAG: DinB family protein [Acidobacteria bacterium]|nr:DinB family protein [Acidobacteriota bacterium]
MAIKDALLPEFDHEMGTTRRLLERLPEDKLSWQPHPKSWNLGQLASHLVNIPLWSQTILNESSFDLASRDESPEAQQSRTVSSRQHALQLLDENVARTRASLASKSDAELLAIWTLTRAGQEIMTVPRIAAFRSFVLNHLIHHRGQFSVYLRMNNVPLPPIYGPTADEAF